MKMKKISGLAILGLMMLSCGSQPKVDGYVLKGNIEGLPDGTHVQLVPVSHDSELPFADTTGSQRAVCVYRKNGRAKSFSFIGERCVWFA